MGRQRRETNGSTGPEVSTGTAEGNAFVEGIDVDPRGSGSLDGLSFAVKDLIDLGGIRPVAATRLGGRRTHPLA